MTNFLFLLFQAPPPPPLPIDQPKELWILFMIMGYIISVFLGLLGFAIFRKIWDPKFDLVNLICDENGKPSLLRFQNLVFTIVIAMGLFWIIGRLGDFPPTIPSNILLLLGISAGTMVVGKVTDNQHSERIKELEVEEARIKQNSSSE